MYITYSDLFQLLIFIVALVGLCYEIFKDKRKQPPLLAIMTAKLKKVQFTYYLEGSRLQFPFCISNIAHGSPFRK